MKQRVASFPQAVVFKCFRWCRTVFFGGHDATYEDDTLAYKNVSLAVFEGANDRQIAFHPLLAAVVAKRNN